jgi:NAD(P)-dependent dehydrogenase (short-subunit alcohol dehydrogenase family)
MNLGIKDKIAIVTGASKGIGKAIAKELAGEGVHLVLCAREKEGLESAAKELKNENNIEVLTVSADLSTNEGVDKVVLRAIEHFEKIDILVNNAGAIRPGTILSKPDADWQVDWELKIFGYLRMIRKIFPVMQQSGGGRIVNIIGLAGEQPNAGFLAGGGANAALMNMTKALADEGAPSNILVNGVNPGPTRTERHKDLMARLAEEKGVTPAEAEAEWMGSNPMKRAANPEEIAAVVVFLVSQRGSYVNGVIIPVDGGGRRGF